jgi:hypothetical protein
MKGSLIWFELIPNACGISKPFLQFGENNENLNKWWTHQVDNWSDGIICTSNKPSWYFTQWKSRISYPTCNMFKIVIFLFSFWSYKVAKYILASRRLKPYGQGKNSKFMECTLIVT